MIGSTPLVRLSRLAAAYDLPAHVLAKVEMVNPGGSHKDRVARKMIAMAEREGRLLPGGVVVEASSGNMGTGLAIACLVKGYHMVVVMPETMSEERRRMLHALGAEIVLTPVTGSERGKVTLEDYHLATGTAARIAEERDGIYADQFHNPANLAVHYEETGPEIWDQSGGEVDAFTAMVGTGATLIGIARALRERNPEIRIYAGEPATSAVLSGQPTGEHRIQGIGSGFVPPFYDSGLVTGVVTVTDEEAREGARSLARHEGIFCGYSSGANIACALKLACQMAPGETIVTLVFDTGLKYVSTDLFG
jgi:cysteine synthase A